MECGKSFLKSLKKSLEVKCPKCTSVDIEIENINEAKFSNDQIYIMRKAYGTLKAMNPSSPTYKKFIKFLDKLPKDQLKQLANAKIKFVHKTPRCSGHQNKVSSIFVKLPHSRGFTKTFDFLFR